MLGRIWMLRTIRPATRALLYGIEVATGTSLTSGAAKARTSADVLALWSRPATQRRSAKWLETSLRGSRTPSNRRT